MKTQHSAFHITPDILSLMSYEKKEKKKWNTDDTRSDKNIFNEIFERVV